MLSFANTSTQPTIPPDSKVSGSPAAIAATKGHAYCKPISISPRAIACSCVPGGKSRYRISVKPSARNSSSATNCGATQRFSLLKRRTAVVSSDPSAASARGRLVRPAALANAALVRNRRRLWVGM
jgi:hypothetical protein